VSSVFEIFEKFIFSTKGFIVSILNANDQSEDVPVCLACAQAMRGKYRLVKIEPDKKFSCVIGKSKFSIFICIEISTYFV